MSSILKEITGATIAGQVRLERATHQGSFLLVEGEQDAKLFSRFCDASDCSIVVCLGRERLLEAMSILERMGFAGALGVADKDLADFVGYPEYEGVVLFSEENDIEIMILASPALENILIEFGITDKVTAVTEKEGTSVEELIFGAAQFVGAMRLLSQEKGWNLSFEGMSYKFMPQDSFRLNEWRTVQHVVGRTEPRPRVSERDVLEFTSKRVEEENSARKLCNGHDCIWVFARALRRKLGSTNAFDGEQGADVLGGILRLSYEIGFFRQTRVYRSIKSWESATGFSVMP